MCDYCDCRSHPQIASLSTDHEVLLELLGRLRRAADADDQMSAMGIIGQLHDLLGGHATQEERGVFTALRDADVGDDYVDRFEHDHEILHELLAQATSEAWKQGARALIQSLSDHILREESDMFPAAHQLLTPSQWDGVDAAVSALASRPRVVAS